MTARCSSCSTTLPDGDSAGTVCGHCHLLDQSRPDTAVIGSPPRPVSPVTTVTRPARERIPVPREQPAATTHRPVPSYRRWLRRSTLAILVVLAMFTMLNVWTPPESRFMHDNDGPYVYRYVSVDHISRHILAATVLHEDGQFGLRFQPFHWGDFVERIADDWAGRDQKTFSTIPQQLAKNMFFTAEQSRVRKALEIVPTMLLGYTLPDSRILELYVNYAEYGRDLFGVCAATWYYFDEPPWNVNVDQAAMLSGMLPNPKDVRRLTGGGVSHPDSAVYPSAAYLVNGAVNVDIPQRLAQWGGWKPVMESVGITDAAEDHAEDRSSPQACSTMPDGVRDRLAAEDPGFVSRWWPGRTLAQVAAAGGRIAAEDSRSGARN